MPDEQVPDYLEPYQAAARRHGAGFGSLLWASPATQAARFAALVRAADPAGRSVLDVGCGRADFLDYCVAAGRAPAEYYGLEAVPALADAAARKPHANMTILRGDFIAEPVRMFVGAEVVAISGALNTLDTRNFYATVRTAFAATAHALAFNFLSSPLLAAAPYLVWHPAAEVLKFARSLDRDADVRVLDNYLDGDTTIAIAKADD